jgi:uncharacterized protein (TIGR03435 family)
MAYVSGREVGFNGSKGFRFHVKNDLRFYLGDATKEESIMFRPPKPAKADESPGFGMEPGRIRSMAVPLEYLAGNLAYVLGRTVIDKTGLAGKYSYMVTYTPDDAPPADASTPSIFTALQEQLGLKLESTKGPVEFLVIDHVEKPDAN